MLTLTAKKVDWTKAIQDIAQAERDKVRDVLELVGISVIAYLQSYVGQVNPPARGGYEAQAKAVHPGGWGDVKGDLARAYTSKVETTKDGWKLILRNADWKAAILEAKEGLFVLSGVTDPGGPVEQALREAAAEHAPGWRIELRAA